MMNSAITVATNSPAMITRQSGIQKGSLSASGVRPITVVMVVARIESDWSEVMVYSTPWGQVGWLHCSAITCFSCSISLRLSKPGSFFIEMSMVGW